VAPVEWGVVPGEVKSAAAVHMSAPTVLTDALSTSGTPPGTPPDFYSRDNPVNSILDGQCPIVLLARFTLMPWHAVIEASGVAALHTDDLGLLTLLGVNLARKARRVLAPHKETALALFGAQE